MPRLEGTVHSDLRHRDVLTNGVRLHLVEAGPADGPPVLLLHGFPEGWFGWRRQLGPLAAAGFRVLAPDQRGYNLSDAPRGLSSYRLDVLAADAVGLLDALGLERVGLVGHDWGGAVAWWVAMTRPGRLHGLAVLNVPHPVVMRRFLRTDRDQRRRSRYMFFFQLPLLPEWRLARDGYRQLRRAVQGTSRPGTFSDQDLAPYLEAWARPGRLRGMLAGYRAALRRPPPRLESLEVEVPVLLIWGARDRALGQEMVPPSLAYCPLGRLELIPDATHWVQHEEPERVNRVLVDLFGVP